MGLVILRLFRRYLLASCALEILWSLSIVLGGLLVLLRIYLSYHGFVQLLPLFQILLLTLIISSLALLAKRLAGLFSLQAREFVYQSEKLYAQPTSVHSAAWFPAPGTQTTEATRQESQRLMQEVGLPSLIHRNHLLPIPVFILLGLFYLYPPPHSPMQKLHLALTHFLPVLRVEPQLKIEPLPPVWQSQVQLELVGNIFPEPLFPLRFRVLSADKARVLLERETNTMMLSDEGLAHFTIELHPLLEDCHIELLSPPGLWAGHFLRIAPPLELVSEAIVVSSPAYLNKSLQTTQRLPPALLDGAILTVHSHLSKPVQSVEFLSHSTGISAEVSGAEVRVSSLHEGPLDWQVLVRDHDGFPLTLPAVSVPRKADETPSIQVIQPVSPWKLQAGRISEIPLRILARDDLGIQNVSIEIVMRQQFEMTWMHTRRQQDLSGNGQTSIDLTTSLPIRPIAMQEGDSGVLKVSVRDFNPDNPTIHAPGIEIQIPYRFQRLEALEEEMAETIDRTKAAKAMHDNLSEMAETLKNRLSATEQVSAEAQEDAAKLLELKEELLKQMSEVQKEVDLELQAERQSEDSLLNDANREKLARIQRTLEELTQGLQLNLQQMQQWMQIQNMGSEQMQAMLNQIDQDQISRELDQTLNSLEDLKNQQNLAKNLEKLSHLRQKHQEWALEMAAGKEPDAESVSQLQETADEIKKDLQAMLQDKDLAPELQERLKEMINQLESMPKDYENLMQTGEEEANQSLWQKSSRLEASLMQFMQEQANQQVSVNLARIYYFLRETADFSRHLQATRLSLLALVGLELKQFAARELFLIDSAARQLEEDFSQEFRQNPDFGGTLVRLIQLLQNRLHSLSKHYESDNPPRDDQDIQGAYVATNQVHSILLQVLDQMFEQQKSQQQQQMSEQMQQMRRKQQDLNQSAKRLRETPMERQARRQMLQQMAIQQQILRESQQQMQNKIGKRSELARRMQELNQEMENLERKLSESEDIDQDLMNAQKQVETRMDEIQEALLQQKESDQREAEVAKDHTVTQEGLNSSPKELEEDVLNRAMQRQDFPLRLLPIIEEFSRRINQI